MSQIQVLDKAVAELIAAGEVVERPASIAKELLENAIDAGSTSIVVEIEDGGVGMLRVSDNGAGILREDVAKAFLRHATSKIRGADDLDGILTLGFRGEALASIAAMCRVELVTKTAGEEEGVLYRVEGGRELGLSPSGRATGTTITVRDVFFNTPARMKFLKKNTSEGSAVAQIVDKCALSHPEISFRFVRDGQTRLQTSGSGELLAVIHAIYGREMASQMTPVEYVHENSIGVRGYISKPTGAKPSRTYQNFFINGRFVRTRTAAAALEEAFKNKIMSGRFPACVLNLELDAATVDVNVHPAKTEVRFAQEKPVFSAVYFAVKSALAKLEQPVIPASAFAAQDPVKARPLSQGSARKAPEPAFSEAPQPQRMSSHDFQLLFGGEKLARPFHTPLPLHASGKVNLDVDVTPRDPQTDEYIRFDTLPQPVQMCGDKMEEQEAAAQQTLEKRPAYRVIGELMTTYILLEKPDGLLLVDKHAAHERIQYEKLKQSIAYGNRQLLLASLTVSLAREDYAALVENPDIVESLGFLVEDFGDGSVIVREIPIELGEKDVAYIVAEIAGSLRANRHDLTPHVLDRLYYSIACKSAVRAGDRNSLPELEEIVRRLAENPHITHCPHGRPVSVELSRGDIEKLFGRQ